MRGGGRYGGLLAAALICVATSAFALERKEREALFLSKTVPLLKQYCLDCHSGAEPDGGLDLTKFKSPQKILENHKTWKVVIQRLQQGDMPPKDAAQPTRGEREFLAGWITDTLNDIDCRGSPEPGRVTIRRLNRREYQNTVRDLTGVDYQPARDFPGDDTGYGFDNIGDVLSTPTILLEKYLTAAEDVAGRAIVTKPPAPPLDKHYYAAKMSVEGGMSQRRGATSQYLLSEGEVWETIPFPDTGEYEFKIMAAGDQAGDEPVKMALKIDGKTIETIEVKNDLDAPKEFTVKAKVNRKTRRVAIAFLNDYWNAEAKKNRDRNLLVTHLHIRGPIDRPPPELPESHRKLLFVLPEGRVTRREATEQVVQRLVSRAFRRPVTDDELKRFVGFAEQSRQDGDSFERSMQLVLEAALVSPQFLYKWELDPPGAEGKARVLNDYEVGSRLSYFLTGSMPDDELFRAMWRKTLLSPAELEAQTRRLLADPKANALVENFASQWLELRSLDIRTPDQKVFPQFNDKLKRAMRTETEKFFEAVIREDRSILDLLDADFTFLNEPLAKLYGIDGVKGDEFRRVSLAETDRGGILTQASILTITSNPTRTSPVKRGKWILENILGTPPPPPPANVPELEKQKLTGTLRQRMEQHRTDPNCAVCHKQMDAMGFAFEIFDAVGRKRSQDGDGKIDPSGELPTGEKFTGPRELQQILRSGRRDDFVRCVSEKLLTFALGRGLEYYDKCAVDKIMEETKRGDYKFSALVLAVVRSDPFLKTGALKDSPRNQP